VTRKKSQEAHQRVVIKNASKDKGTEVALAEYRREQDALSKRTAELRALRLEHEAKFGPLKKAPVRQVTQPVKYRTLSDWLQDKKESGRET